MKPSNQTMLYVEDDPHHAVLVLRSLETIAPGLRVVHVEDGEAAVRYVEGASESDRPTLVLLDLRLPKLDGLEVLARLKGNEAHVSIPVVVFSTSASDRDISRAYASHANSYLVKPTDLSSLQAMLRDLQDYWFNWNQTVSGEATLGA